MKAIVHSKYGGPEVLTLMEIEKPRPKENEVLVKVHATTVTSGDVRLRGSDFPLLFLLPARIVFGLFKPKKRILGHEFSGTVESVGGSVTRFKVGDEIFGTTTMLWTGAYAEYLCVPEVWKQGVIALKPEKATFQEAASLPIGAMTAMFLLEKAKLKKGQTIVIYGASGSVGSYAVQIAKSYGAKVTGISSTSNLEMVRSLGAKKTLDYTKQEFRELEPVYDIFFDAVGKVSKRDAKKIVRKNGKYVSVKMLTKEKVSHLNEVKRLFDEGKIKPLIDRTYSLEEIPEAHIYVETGRKKGNVSVLVRDHD